MPIIHPAVEVVMEAMSVWDTDDKETRRWRAMMVVSHLIEFGHIEGTHRGFIPHRPRKKEKSYMRDGLNHPMGECRLELDK